MSHRCRGVGAIDIGRASSGYRRIVGSRCPDACEVTRIGIGGGGLWVGKVSSTGRNYALFPFLVAISLDRKLITTWGA